MKQKLQLIGYQGLNVSMQSSKMFLENEKSSFLHTVFNVINSQKNGTMCKASMFNDSNGFHWNNTDEYNICNFTNINLKQCIVNDGSHTKSFWVYFPLRIGLAVKISKILNINITLKINYC